MSSPPAKRVRLEVPDVEPETVKEENTTEDRLADLKSRYPCLKDSLSAPHMTEQAAGITQYVDAAVPAFSAIIKHRFTDFLVYEVTKAGQVVELKNIQRPAKEDNGVAEAEAAKQVEKEAPSSVAADGQLVGFPPSYSLVPHTNWFVRSIRMCLGCHYTRRYQIA